MALLFIKHVFKLHELPQSIVSDKNRTLTSTFWKELFSAQGVQLAFSIAYHPQLDGSLEVVNKTLEVVNKTLKTYLTYFVGNQPKIG